MRPRRRTLHVALVLVAGLISMTAASGLRADARSERSDSRSTSSARAASRAPIKGQGSTYVGLAMNQWKAAGQSRGLDVNYLPNGSPSGLGAFNSGSVDFAGTEAEFSSLLGGDTVNVPRGYQYVPDVGGAVSIMYNMSERSGRKVTYLHLSRRTIAKIFTSQITNWSDPQISADNKGLKFPNKPILVVYRGGQSGTTALFYDFVANTDRRGFNAWAGQHQFSTAQRIIQLDNGRGEPYPNSIGFNSSDQIAQYVSNTAWSIGYDEFGYAKTYHANVAWVDNSGGRWTQPYAENIAAALTAARLRPDLSQELSGVYVNRDPLTYPLSAYSYLVTQCARAGDRPTCKGPYNNAGVAQTLKEWMGYIACDGQVSMARIGYSPLPQNLSQEIMNSVGRMTGNPGDRKVLNAGNCSNPRFRGNLGPGSVNPYCDPFLPSCTTGQRPPSAGGGGGGGGGGTAQDPTQGGGGGGGGSSTAPQNTATGANNSAESSNAAKSSSDGATSGAEQAAALKAAAERAKAGGTGRSGGSNAVGGGTGISRKAEPTSYKGDKSPNLAGWPLIVMLVVLIAPVGVGMVLRRRGRAAASGPF